MKLLLALLALVAGAGLACQVGFNSHLGRTLGHPVPAALTNFVVGLVCLLAIAGASGVEVPSAQAAASAPWWAWLGGLVGACYVAVSAAFARKLGATAWLGAIVTGQITASMALDHFGWLGFEEKPVSLVRALGVLLLLVGVVLVLWEPRRG